MSGFDTLFDHARRVQHARYRAIQYTVPGYVTILDQVLANGVQNIAQDQVESLRAIEDDLIQRENNARGIT